MLQHNSMSENVAGSDGVLTKSLERLRESIAVNVPGNEREWAEAVGTAIDAVKIALRQHKAAARDPQGLFAEVDTTRPTLSRQADEIRQGHGVLLQDILNLRKEVFRAAVAFAPPGDPTATNEPGGVVDQRAIRQHAERVLSHLHQISEAETKLVQESLNTDIGVGD